MTKLNCIIRGPRLQEEDQCNYQKRTKTTRRGSDCHEQRTEDCFGKKRTTDYRGRRGPRTAIGRRGPQTTMGRRGNRTAIGRRGPQTVIGRRGPQSTMGRRGPQTALWRRGTGTIIWEKRTTDCLREKRTRDNHLEKRTPGLLCGEEDTRIAFGEERQGLSWRRGHQDCHGEKRTRDLQHVEKRNQDQLRKRIRMTMKRIEEPRLPMAWNQMFRTRSVKMQDYLIGLSPMEQLRTQGIITVGLQDQGITWRTGKESPLDQEEVAVGPGSCRRWTRRNL